MERLAYGVLACSGEDPEFPAVELTQAGPQTRGWQSPKYCDYPQELVLSLGSLNRVNQIQLLSHECKIASKVELFVGTLQPDSPDPSQAQWRRLGSLTFDKNERSNYQARELKSVQVNATAHFLRVVLQRPHANKFNLKHQVAVVGISLYGEAAAETSWQHALPTNPTAPASAVPQSAAMSQAHRAALQGVDAVTAQRIMDLNQKKAAAVAEENYDEAKTLKQEIDRLKALGARVLNLEKRKQAAIEEEDYDTAKAIKGEIAVIRAGGRPSRVDEVVIRVDASGHGTFQGQVSPNTPAAASAARAGAQGSTLCLEMGSPSASEHDERPAQARGTADTIAAAAPPEQRVAELVLSRDTDTDNRSSLGPPPEGWPSGLPPPEQHSAADMKEADDVCELLGAYVAAALYSRTWQLREAALQRLSSYLNDNAAEKQKISAASSAATRAIQRAIKERVPNVFQAGLQVLHQLIEATAQVAPRDAASLTSDVLPTLLEKIGDSNARIQSAASAGILHLAKLKESGLQSMAAAFVRPVRQTTWRPVLARLQLLASLIPVWGVSGSGGEDGLPLEGLMEFVGAAFVNANADVRSAAVNVTVLAHGKAGQAVAKLLARDINPKIKEQIDAAIMPPSLPPAAALRRTSKGSASHPAAEQRKSSSNGSQNAPQEPTSAPASSHVHLEELEASVSTEDPTPYQMELISREQILGPSHPEVAVSLSNLAILHNQRGEYTQAQPLYERALAIFEMNFGPLNANVAHTLTDLAVLHLEQGNVEAGRPLLERALGIQEKALGPDHPDVIAIRDVLDDKDE